MTRAWENNPNGICEDAPCCGCCGPQGDGVFDPAEPPENDPYDDYYDRPGHDEDYDYDEDDWTDERLSDGIAFMEEG